MKECEWEITLIDGNICAAKIEGVTTSIGVRKWLNGSENLSTSLGQFVSIGENIIINKNQIVVINKVPLSKPRKWYKFWRPK